MPRRTCEHLRAEGLKTERVALEALLMGETARRG
jgi:hypothetical protein